MNNLDSNSKVCHAVPQGAVVDVDTVLRFVLKNRKHKVFKQWSVDQMRERFIAGAFTKQFVYTTDAAGKLVGVLLAESRPAKKELHIMEVLTTAPGALRAMLAKFKEWYGDGWTMTARRKGRDVVYNTPRLVHLLERI